MSAVDHPSPSEVTLFLDGDSLYLRGSSGAIDTVVDQVLEHAPAAGRRSRSRAADALAVGMSASVLGPAGSEELLKLTPESLAKVKELGIQTDSTGALRGFVRDPGGQFAGQLSFETVSFGAEQAMAMQTAAVALALRTAIADVEAAVEAVDKKVADVQRRLRSRNVGEVVGTYRHLRNIHERTMQRGRLLEADWDQVAYSARDLTVALEELRDFVTSTVNSVGTDQNLAERRAAIKALGDEDSVGASLRLILVAEQALHLQQVLRLERVWTTEPDHYASALEDAQQSLDEQHQLNDRLVQSAVTNLQAAAEIDPLEVHRIISIRTLPAALDSALTELESFADSARVDRPEIGRDIARPNFSETRDEIRREAVGAARGIAAVSRAVGQQASTRAKGARSRLRRRGSTEPSSPPELTED